MRQKERETDPRRWSANSSRQIVKRIVVKGTLVLETPAHFGAGDQDGTELIILQDALEGHPLLPGASLAGALRHYLLQRERGFRAAEGSDSCAVQLFGKALDEQSIEQSRVIVDDALGKGTLSFREGVKIEGKRRTANEGALFTTQTWAEGTTFDLCFELYLCADDNEVKLKQAFAAALQGLANGEIPLGARKHRGYGRCKVNNWQVYEYDLCTKEGLLDWIQGKPLKNTQEGFFKQAEKFSDERQRVRIEATFKLCDSLLIRSGADMVDMTHLSSANGDAVLSGTSVTGALRARAWKIANTLNRGDKAVELVDDMFGKHGSDQTDSDDFTASRLILEEHVLAGVKVNHVQNRVKIDRFTGGAYETGLFSQQPVFADDKIRVQINMELRYQEGLEDKLHAETGLLLLLLKDLWTEDLPLGGESSVGRGRLQGMKATIKIGNARSPEEIEFNAHGLADKRQVSALQAYVDSLWQWLEAADEQHH